MIDKVIVSTGKQAIDSLDNLTQEEKEELNKQLLGVWNKGFGYTDHGLRWILEKPKVTIISAEEILEGYNDRTR
jgi:hypothetical protein